MLGFQRVHGILIISDSSDPSCVSYTQVAVMCVKCHVELRTQFHNHDDSIDPMLLLVARIYLNFATVKRLLGQTAWKARMADPTAGDIQEGPGFIGFIQWWKNGLNQMRVDASTRERPFVYTSSVEERAWLEQSSCTLLNFNWKTAQHRSSHAVWIRTWKHGSQSCISSL